MRKLASVQKIIDIQSIPNADAIEVATVLGWKVVIKKGSFDIGDLCVYFEIDSLLPELPEFEFLKTSSWKEKLNAYRLKTIKLRGQVSQGLILPISDIEKYVDNVSEMVEGDDLTELLKIEKYEPPMTESEDGQSKGYNWEISKTDEERVQSDPSIIEKIKGLPYYASLKLDGTSSTFILSREKDELLLNVCSRNLCLKEINTITKDDGSIVETPNEGKYWKIAKQYSIKEKMLKHYEKTNKRLAIQGEIIGEGIQSNRMNIKGRDLYVFNVFETDDNNNFIKMEINDAIELMDKFEIKFVPIVEMSDNFNFSTVEELLEFAKGNYCDYPEFKNADKNQPQEGIVIRTWDGDISFKVINNDFLLEGGD